MRSIADLRSPGTSGRASPAGRLLPGLQPQRGGTCPTRIPKKNVHAGGGVMNALPPSGSPAACVRGAERRGPRPIGPCAGTAAKSVARPPAQDARRPRRLAYAAASPGTVREFARDRSRRRDRARQDARTHALAHMLKAARGAGRRDRERKTAIQICVFTAFSTCRRTAWPAPDRTLCRHCGEKRRKAERARCAKAKAAGILYGGRDPERCREFARDRSRRRDRARQDARTCTRCGTHPPIEDGTVCEPCRVARRDRERDQYAARRIAGLCGRCGTPAPSDAAYCDRCAGSAAKRSRKMAKNARSRQRYSRRRARRLCVDCAAPSQGASRCPPCARRSWARSGEHRGLPVLPPRVTVIEIATGKNHGTWDRWEDVVVCLAFAKLSRDQVELIPDM